MTVNSPPYIYFILFDRIVHFDKIWMNRYFNFNSHLISIFKLQIALVKANAKELSLFLNHEHILADKFNWIQIKLGLSYVFGKTICIKCAAIITEKKNLQLSIFKKSQKTCEEAQLSHKLQCLKSQQCQNKNRQKSPLWFLNLGTPVAVTYCSSNPFCFHVIQLFS